VVLPVTGKNSLVAQKTLRGLQLGLGLYGEEPSDFRLAVGDSEGRPEKAKSVTQSLIENDGSIAIVGSILSKNALAVAEAARDLGTPSISLSQRQGVTQVSPLSFRNTLTSEIQVKTLVKVAMKDKGLKRFAILFPNDPYGVEMANLFWDEVLARGGTITGAQAYSPDETDFKVSIQKLTGLNDASARTEEYKARLREVKANKKDTSTRERGEDILPPVTDFEALFIPDSVKALGQISAMLAFSGVRNVHLLGPNLWNQPTLARRVNQSFNPVLFVDFPPLDSAANETEFTRLYKKQFSEPPGLFEIQGYEAGLLLRTLIMSGAADRQALASALAETKTFPGAQGPIAQYPTREFHRPLILWTLSQGQIAPYVSNQ
jgi:ABC-type branched-subunit amino acid transport system substrate-binding protein